MTTREIREKFLEYFRRKDHTILDSVSLVTSDEKGVTDSTLFNTAGVQPLVPYLLGEEHPEGKRLASSQKCVRTIDIEEVGDLTHLTFFEMLGNWSLGDYFKEEAIEYSYEFLTKVLGLDPERIYITAFAGNDVAEKDTEALEAWKKFVPENRVYFLEDNWWEAGENGPCGPDTEIFYDLTGSLGDMTHEEFVKADDEQKVVEIWNNVFMQYEKRGGEVVGKLPQHAVDTGAGLERLAIILNNVESVYETDGFSDLINFIDENSGGGEISSKRIVADHVKASTMLIADGVLPSNTDRGYILRRLIRRAVREADRLGLPVDTISKLVPFVSRQYEGVYDINVPMIATVVREEEEKFRKTLEKGLREIEKIIEKKGNIDGNDAFVLFTSYGFPVELVEDIAKEKDISVNLEEFEKKMKEHQDRSRTAAEGKFKGGLGSDSEMGVKYHTATHLLHQALRDVLGDHVEQRGSNINDERLRFDFAHDEKMTDEQKDKVERIVNEKIEAGLPVNMVELPKEEALNTGALHLFGDKYGDVVSVYYIGEDLDSAYSKEFCGGPHVENTNVLGKFRIKKEEASSAGVRRIKGVLE